MHVGNQRGRRKTPCRHERGHTLIEAIIAMFVFVIGALGLLQLIYSSADGVTVASKLTHAVSLGRGKLDQLIWLPYNHADLAVGAHEDGAKNLGPDGTTKTPEGNDTGDFGSQDGWFARSWTVTENTDQTFKTITVSLRWWDGAVKRTREYSVVGGRSYQ